MAYSLHTVIPSRKRTPAVSRARPKSHTPGPQLQQRGLRYYKPELGRWVSRDPIGEWGGWNLYAALRNGPLNRIDKHGLSCASVKAEGFSTPEEKTKIDAMLVATPKCTIPEIICDFNCASGDDKGYFKDGKVGICQKFMRSDSEYRKTRKHELSHAFDACKGSKVGCDLEGLKVLACSELRAYKWGTGITGKERLIRAAAGSVKKACPSAGGRGKDGDDLREAMAGMLYDECTGLGATDALPTFPASPTP